MMLATGLQKVYLLEFLDSFASFVLDFILVLYLSNEYHMGDVSAGWLYAVCLIFPLTTLFLPTALELQIFGCLVIVYGILFGCLIDYFGVQRILLAGALGSLLGRLCLLNASTKTEATLCLLFLCPASTALTGPILKLTLRRYTYREDREEAFHVIYVVINLASICAALCLSFTRRWFLQHCVSTAAGTVCKSTLFSALFQMIPWGFQSFLRLTLLVSIGVTLLQLLLSLWLLWSPPLWEPAEAPLFSLDASYRLALSLPNVWSCFYIGLATGLGVGALMRHFGATFPKYYTRQFGHTAAFETILMLNPLIGTAISAASVFVLALESTQRACVTAMIIFTLGEVMWSPKLMELCVTVGEEGREGVTLAFAAFPKFLSRMVAGILSGHILGVLCPAKGDRHPQAMWMLIGLSALSTPLLLLLFKTRLFTPDLLLHSDTDTICKQSLEAMQPCVIKQEGLLFVDAEDAASTASCSPLNTR